ncbi:MAG: hypothetical protein ACXWLH_05390 [Candidatus Saccharimonadales bacterium]
MSKSQHYVLMIEREPAEKTLEYYLERIKALPKPPLDDPRITSGEGYKHSQFGNNFYLLWLSLRSDIPHSPFIDEIYGDRARALPGWGPFLVGAHEPVRKLFTVMSDLYAPAEEVNSYLYQIINEDDAESIKAMKEAVAHPFGLNAQVAYVWDAMNPALEEVADAMKEYGLDPEQFYG